MLKTLVTGANGFVGQAVCTALAKRGHEVKAAVRTTDRCRVLAKSETPVIADIETSPPDVWRAGLHSVDILIHLAAHVHQRKTKTDQNRYQKVNNQGTAHLCRLAVDCGVRRIIFLSSLKVNGETATDPLLEKSAVNPQDPYAQSKWEAEKHIQGITRGSTTDFVIIRPPLVYGPRVRANFLSLLKVVSADIPLPLGSLHNRRSMIYVGNLADAVVAAAEHPHAAGQVFMVSDGQDLTVTEMIETIAVAMGQKPRLFPFPVGWLHGPLRMFGKGAVVDKISRPLTVDSSKIRNMLDWHPPFTVQEGIDDAVAWFKTRADQNRKALS